MDKNVLDAIKKWPDVPAVYGWLSLDLSGKWKLHPAGSYQPGKPGESISSPQINNFINRNYAATEKGEWFFQNGPQRVYVCLEHAPYALHLAEDGLTLDTHTLQTVQTIHAWYLDEQGFLYAQTNLGAAIICGRDTPQVIDCFSIGPPNDPDGKQDSLSEKHLLELRQGQQLDVSYRQHPEYSAPLQQINSKLIPEKMNFITRPMAE
ncbi:DUF2946 family protein [Advenella sp. WQ 585]|uniref:DUF2946 family protein n=1 Tax=Advenella mandrilli TaxID=2800330 RepID=A0ABS1EE82_9BURK|nr:DUF2946 family protein [Advenella mandrilli]MBK1782046.1 DUF2946 family protein [Advenella mandrilli]